MADSTPSNGVNDPYDQPLKAGPTEPLIQAGGPHSGLNNPGTDGADDRAPSPVPMHPYGWERDGEPLFQVEAGQTG